MSDLKSREMQFLLLRKSFSGRNCKEWTANPNSKDLLVLFLLFTFIIIVMISFSVVLIIQQSREVVQR